MSDQEPIKPLPKRAAWAEGRPARSFRFMAEPVTRAIWAEQERDEAEVDVTRLVIELAEARAELAASREREHRLEHDLRQERERRGSVERRHKNLVDSLPSFARSRFEMEKQLDALLWVWCSGGCAGGVLRWTHDKPIEWWHRRDEVTEEIVALAEQNTRRLRSWFEGNKHRPLRAREPAAVAPEAGENA
jgi:hypothetical protein